MIIHSKKAHLAGIILGSLALAACGGSSNKNSKTTMKEYRVTVSNVTANQPFSPVAVITHAPSYSVFKAGQSASVALEHLAEEGSNKQLLDEAGKDSAVIAGYSGKGLILPGKSESLTISVPLKTNDFKLSIASMLVNTNDAFASHSTSGIADLKVGDSFEKQLPAWDAGTEINDESSGVPGPAAGGNGFEAIRDDIVNVVTIHQGVVTQADGLSTSKLNASHRFDNPVGLLRIERIK